MSGRTTAILGIVLALLALGYWGMLRWEGHSRQEDLRSRRLFDFDPSAVEDLRLNRKGEPAVAAHRDPGEGWAIVEPHTIAANPEPWNRMAEAVAGLTNERTVADDRARMEDYGLDAPGLVVRVRAAGRDHALAFGRTTPMQDHRYARLDDGPVMLVQDAAHSVINRPLEELRERTLLRATPGSVTRIEFARMGAGPDGALQESVPVVVEKDEDGRWQLKEPVDVAADQETVGALAAMLEQTPGRDFVDAPESLDDYRLTVPRARIRAWTAQDSEPQTVYFGALTNVEPAPTGGREQGVYVKREKVDSVFVVPASIITFFPEKPDSFRDRRLFTHLASRINRMRLTSGEKEVIIEDDAREGWKVVQPAGQRADQVIISAYINALKRIMAEEFLAIRPEEAGLNDPASTVELTLVNGKTVKMAVAKSGPREEAVYALQDTGAVVLVPDEAVEMLRVEPFLFQAKEIFEFRKENLVRLVLHFEGVEYAFRHGDDGRWTVDQPPAKKWELQSDMESLLQALNGVRATWQELSSAPEDLSSLGLDPPVLKVEAYMAHRTRGESDIQVGPLLVGRPLDDASLERYAVVAGRPGVFRVRQALIDEVREALRGIRDQ